MEIRCQDDSGFFCAIRRSGDRRACTSRHLPGAARSIAADREGLPYPIKRGREWDNQLD